jgi:hypothetical protein
MKSKKRIGGAGLFFTILAVLAVSLYEPQPTSGQGVPQTAQFRGMFGNRTLGQPLTPIRNTFVGPMGGGMQRTPDGTFAGITRPGTIVAAAPGLQTGAISIQPGAMGVVAQQPIQANYFAPPMAMPSSAAADNGLDLAGQLEQAPVTAPTAEPPRAWNYAVPEAAVPTPQPQASARSPELSNLLTRLARAKGLLVSPEIGVYFVNNVAVVTGTVRTPGDGTLLVHLLSLEPGVRTIENRLVAESAVPSPKP